jgi:hypothetical protein
MPVSTVADSILGALGSMASASDRRAREGLVAEQAKAASLANEANQRILDKDAARTLFAEIDGGGYAKFNDQTKQFDVDIVGMSAKNPELAARFMGGKGANDWINHIDPATGKKTDYTFSRFVEIDPRMGADGAPAAPPVAAGLGSLPASPADQRSLALSSAPGPISLMPGQISQAPQVGQAPTAAPDAPAAPPKRYMMLLKKADGTEVPATQNGTSDPKDPLITMSEDDIKAKSSAATARIQALDGMHNDVTLQHLQTDLSEIVRANMAQRILDSGGAKLDFDAAAKRQFLDAVDGASLDELPEMARMIGLDPDKMRKEAEGAFADTIKAKAENANLKPKSSYDYEGTKSGLTDLVSKSEKALTDYDTAQAAKANKGQVAPSNLAAGSMAFNPYTMGKKDEKPKDTPERKKLVAALEFAKSAQSNLVRPAVMDALPPGTPEPKFEWTPENIKASIRGKLDQPTPEQTQALAAYGQSMGIKSASDLANIPPAKADALIWAIVANSDGTPEQKMTMFDKLNSFVQTGDPDKSAIDVNFKAAETDIQRSQVDAQIAGNIRSTNASMYGDNLRAQQWGADHADKLGEAAWKKSEDVVTAFRTTVNPWLKDIQEGTLEENGQYKQLASNKALSALEQMGKEIKRDFTTSLSVAAQPYYAESFLKVLVAQAGEGSAASPLWDWAKGFANMFMRTEPRVTMSAIASSWRVKKWENGRPTEYALMEPFRDGGNKPTERTIGALELGRYVGVDAMNTMNDIIYSQRAKDELEGKGEDASPAAVDKRRRELYEADSKANK